MRQTQLKSVILNLLLVNEDRVPDLWARAEKHLGKHIAVRTFYDAVNRLRDDGLVTYRSRQFTDAQWDSALAELAGGPTAANIPDDDEVGLVRLTARGQLLAEVYSLQELVSAPQKREAARRIQRVQHLIGAVGVSP